MEVPFVFVFLEVSYLTFEFVKLFEDHGNFNQDRFLSMLAVLHVTKSLLLEKAINEQTFNFLKLSKQLVELLVVVLFN